MEKDDINLQGTPPVEVFDLGTTGTCVTKKIAGAFVSLI